MKLAISLCAYEPLRSAILLAILLLENCEWKFRALRVVVGFPVLLFDYYFFVSSPGCEYISYSWSHQAFPDHISNAECKTVWLSWTGVSVHCKQTVTGKALDRKVLSRYVGNTRCLPFTKRFPKIRLERKWKTTFWVVPAENFREKRNIWKGSPVFPNWMLQTEIRVLFLQNHPWY